MKWTRAIICCLSVILCTVLIIAPTTSVTAGRQTYDITDYFPLNQGDTYRYRNVDSGQFGDVLVGGTVSLGGVYTATQMIGGSYGAEEYNYFSVGPAGLTHYGFCETGAGDCGILDPGVFIPNGITPGWSQHFTGTLRNMAWDDLGPYELDVAFVGVQTVTVPAGTFTDCLRFRVEMNGDVDEMFFAPAVGQVKTIGDPPADDVSELVAARAGGAEHGYYDSEEYFPLHEGDRWLYDDGGTFFIQGTEWQWMHWAMSAFVHEDPLDPNQGLWWSNGDDEGVQAHGEDIGGQWDSPLPLLEERCALGDRLEQETWTGSDWLRLVATVEGIEETVTVPAGTFEHCLRVKLEWAEGGTPTLDETWWLAPGVGRVKIEQGPGGGGLTGKGRAAPAELIAAIVAGTVYPNCPVDPDVVGMWDLANLERWVEPPGTWVQAPDPEQWQHTSMAVRSDGESVQRAPTGDWTKSLGCADPGTHKLGYVVVDSSDPSSIGDSLQDADYTVSPTQWVMTYFDADVGAMVRLTWTRVPCGHDSDLDGLWRLTARTVDGAPYSTPDIGAIHENFADGAWRRDYPWGGWQRGTACVDASDLTVMFLQSSDPSDVGTVINATYSLVFGTWRMTYEVEGHTIQDTFARLTCQQDPDAVGTWRLTGGVPPPDPEELGAILMLRGTGDGRRTSPEQEWEEFDWCASNEKGFVTMTDASNPSEIGLRMIFDYAYSAIDDTLTITMQDEGGTQTEVYERVVCDDYPESVGTWTSVAYVSGGWPEWDEVGATITVYGPAGQTWRYESPDMGWMEGTACVDTTTHEAFFEVTDASDPDAIGEVMVGSLHAVDSLMSIRQNEQGEDGVSIFQRDTCSHDASLDDIWDGVAPGDGYLVIDDDGTMHVGDPDGWWWLGPSCTDGGALTAAVAYCGKPATNGELYQDTYSLVGDTLTVTIQTLAGPETRTYQRTTCGHDAALEDDWELTGETVNGSPQFANIGAILNLNPDGTYREDYPNGDWHDGTWCLDGGEGFMRIETMQWGDLRTGGIIRCVAYDLAGGQLTLDYWYDDPFNGTTDHFVRTYARPDVPGDFDDDGDVDLNDLSLFRPYWGAEQASGGSLRAFRTRGAACRPYEAGYDLNDDGVVDFWDFIAFWRDNAPHHDRWVEGDTTGTSPQSGCPNQGYPNAGPDDHVDFWDLMAFAGQWHTSDGDPGWDPMFDFAGPGGIAPPEDPPCPVDDTVNFYDLVKFAENWHSGDGPPAPLAVKGADAPRVADLGIGTVRVAADAEACLVGEQVQVTVTLADAAGLTGYEVDLLYEPSKLALVEGAVTPGTMLDGAEEEPLRISHTKAPGVASFAAMLPGRKPTGVSGTGTLVTLRFTALEPTDEPPLRVKTALLADEQRRVSAPRVSVAPLRIARLGPNDWRARIVARVDGLEPVSRPFGIIEDETLRQALGTRRIEADPALDVRFLTDEGEAPAAYRGPDDGPVSFRFAVSSDRPNADVLLTVPDLRLLPRRHALRLTDETGGAVVHLRTRNTYRFNTGANPGQRTFRLDVLDARAAVLRVSDLVARPLRGGGVVLQFRLSADAATSIDVTNLAGIRVRRLEKGTLRPAGPQSATWDGKSDAGTVAPAGTYIVRVRAASEDGRTATATTALTLQR